MPKRAKAKANSTASIAGRGDKPRKKNPGVSPNAHNGKTTGGYTPARLRARQNERMRQFLLGGDGELRR